MLPRLRTAALAAVVSAILVAPAAAVDVQALQSAALSERAWPEQPRPAAGAPNVLVVMTDDVGFGAATSFGGRIPTPAFDEVGERGLRYNNFMTAAVCSPTRASLLTGRLPQEVGMGYTANWPTPHPGYNTEIPDSAATVADHLRKAGYATAMFGKAHLTPEWELGPSGPFDRWPTGLGFDYFYGILGADTSLFEPTLVENTRAVPRPQQPDYHLERDMADRAIGWLRDHATAGGERPFFLYYAMPTAHAPHHAPAEWLERFRGRFDDGWDALRRDTLARQKALGLVPADVEDVPRPEGLAEWSALSADQRRLYARYMEAYAASLAYADAQLHRVLQELERQGTRDNTLVIYIQGDNGASAEGRPHGLMFEQSALNRVTEPETTNLAAIDRIGTADSYPLIPAGWSWAMNTPFRWAKRYASHFGGTRNGVAISWPSGIRERGVRAQLHHVSDVMPTILEVAGVTPADTFDGVPQQPVTGISMRYSFDDAGDPGARTRLLAASSHYLSIIDDGWMASTVPYVSPWGRTGQEGVAPQDRSWELYDLRSDFNQRHDLAAREPGRLQSLVSRFWSGAGAFNLLPIHTSEGQQQGMPGEVDAGKEYRYRDPVSGIPGSFAPRIVGRSFRLSATLETEARDGVVVAHGGRYAGYALFLHEGRVQFTYALNPQSTSTLACPEPERAGTLAASVEVRLDEEKPGAAATVTLRCAGGKASVAQRLARTFPLIVSHTEPFDIGADTVSPVDPRYTSEDSVLAFRNADIRYEWLGDAR